MNIAFIGYGNMARALIQGALNAGALKTDQIIISSPSLSSSHTEKYAFRIASCNIEAASEADCIFLCTKPAVIATVCTEISDVVRQKTPLIASIAAGISTQTLEKHFRCNYLPIIRVMPNTPVSVGAGVIGFYANAFVTAEQQQRIKPIFNATATVIPVEMETELDKITAISGSGPAYFLLIQELIIHAAKQLGLSEQTASTLVQETMLGTAILISKSKLRPEILRSQVTSKGGTTEAAITSLINGGLEALIHDAVFAAYQRALELA